MLIFLFKIAAPLPGTRNDKSLIADSQVFLIEDQKFNYQNSPQSHGEDIFKRAVKCLIQFITKFDIPHAPATAHA
jgi:hypothetical protein